MESLRGVNVSLSALEVLATLNTTLAGEDSVNDRLWGGPRTSYLVSVSTGTVKAGPGVFYGVWGSTAGTMAVKDGANQLGVLTVSANVLNVLPFPITCATSITISASAAVGTILYV